MKIKLLRAGKWNTTGVKEGPFVEGEENDEAEVSDAFGAKLIAAEAAVEVVQKKASVAHQPKKEAPKAEPKKPAKKVK